MRYVECHEVGKLLIKAIVLMLLLPALSFPHEEVETSEIFRWFPIGIYSSYKHFERAEMERAELYPVFESNFNIPYMMYKDRMLPPSLRDRYTSETAAGLFQEKYKKGEGWMQFFNKSREKQKELLLKGERPQPAVKNDLLVVWRYDDLDSLIAEALKSGEISETGEVILERPVYSYYTEEYTGPRYAYATATQEFLSADKPENLRAMIAAGLGLELNLLDHETNAELVDVIPGLGQFWKITNKYPSRIRTIEHLKQSEAPQEQIDFWLDRIERGWQFHGYVWNIDSQIVMSLFHVFGDPEHPESKMPPCFYNAETDYGREYNAVLKTKALEESYDTMRIVHFVFDEELLAAYKKMKEAAEEQRKQQEAEQAEEEKEEH